MKICPELRMNPSATFMSFQKLGNVFVFFFNSWVIIEVINEVGYITWEEACSGCWHQRDKRWKTSKGLCPAAIAQATQGHILLSPEVSHCVWDIQYQVSWAFLPPLKPPTAGSYKPLHICLSVSRSLYISSPWEVELKLFCPMLKYWDNAGSVAAKILYMNSKNKDVPTNLWVSMHAHTEVLLCQNVTYLYDWIQMMILISLYKFIQKISILFLFPWLSMVVFSNNASTWLQKAAQPCVETCPRWHGLDQREELCLVQKRLRCEC